ncbi:phytanoyl-CoA dioxygenase family protein [Paraburkholderia sp. J63]|uniref:phytanoyl-CoA dioxygenase family protein n=1 Tax=Paraburkholderia sp. J63 TaxID=2805434 RepID=UPI002ABD7B43|nr:phytanoyl-CoA dioxygenase family protein [Paraburkholderia sp. J63]
MLVTQSQRDAFRNDGAVLIENCLDEAQLAQCYEVFKWIVANPGPHHYAKLQTHIDNANPGIKERLDALVMALPFGQVFRELWGSEHVWYFAEEVFSKEGGNSGRGPWHQDTANLPWAGRHWGNAWISFQKLPKHNALEVIRASHLGIQYDGASFKSAEDPTDPLYGDGVYPRLPHIDRELAQNPSSWDVLSWPVTPGDVLFLHPHSLHGGAAVDAACPMRHTLVLRFFGDDATFRILPDSNPDYVRNGLLFREEMAKLNEGDSFRSPIFRQVV